MLLHTSAPHRLAIGAVTFVASTVLVVAPIAASLTSAAPSNAITDSPAATLRVNLNRLGEEHVYLAGAALNAVVAGRAAEADVASNAVDKNTKALGEAVGSVYGSDAETAFLKLWRAHIGFFADYAKAAKNNDQAGKQHAMQNLDGYRNDIDALLTGANPNLPKGVVAQLFAAHVQHLTMAIDDLAAGDLNGAYTMLHTAGHQTQDIMDPLAAAIVKQFPDKFPGDPMSPAATLRVGLNDLGEEHVYFAGYALNAAISGRTDEFQVAAQAVDMNTQELGGAVGSVYGPDAETAFLKLWRAHIGFFADYAMAAVGGDRSGQDQAMHNLDGYRTDIDALLTGANPNLPKGAVAQLFAEHVMHLTMVIDDLAGQNVTGAYAMLHQAAHQTMDIMDPLSEAIAKQFPDKFSANEANPTAARDGLTLASQTPQTQAAFNKVWGSNAATEWVMEHNAELARTGH